MLIEILPNTVIAVEKFGPFSGSLLGPEEDAILHAAPARRMEFAAGRACAREALRQIGLPDRPILRGPSREPVWPTGICGSITHCIGYCAAAVSRVGSHVGLGVDAEPNEPLPADTRATIATNDDLSLLRELPGGEIHWERLLFSAKESVFKAFYPLYRQWLGFQEVSIRFNPEQQTFEASFSGKSAANGPLVWPGRFTARNRFVVTAIVLPAR